MTWTAMPAERRMLYSQIGLRLVDEFTGEYPAAGVSATLERELSAGGWRSTDIGPELTPSGNLSFPGLGLSADAAVAPIERYRVIVASDAYVPEYRRTLDALEFDVRPYDHSNPPAVIPALPDTLMLLPSVNYPYPRHLRVVRGRTVDAGSNPISFAEVTEGVRERVLSDERGIFAIPLRWPALAGPVVLDAVDHRTGRTDNLTVNLPGDLLTSHTFTLT